MAIRPADQYGLQVLTSDPAYPHGQARNEVVAGDGVGTPLEAGWVNDLWGMQQALLDAGSVTPSGRPDRVGDSDYIDALNTVIARGVEPLERVVRGDAELGSPPTRTITLHGSAFRTFTKTGGADAGFAGLPTGGNGWRLILASKAIVALLPLNRLLPDGAGLLSARLLMRAGTHTVGGRLGLHLVGLDFDRVAVSPHIERTDETSGTGLQVLEFVGSPFARVDQTSALYLSYDPHDLTFGADILEGVQLTFEDPGPRNW